MHTKRTKFSQPYWEYVLPLISWVGCLPILFLSIEQYDSSLVVGNLDFYLNSVISSKYRMYVASSLSISVLSWAINTLINEHTLMHKRGFLPSLVAVFFGVLAIIYTGFSFSYIAVGLLVLSVSQLFKSSRENRSYSYIFNSGFLLGVGFLADFRIWIGGVFLLLSLMILRSPRIRDFIVLLIGLLNVVFVFGAYKFLFDDEIIHFLTLRHYLEVDAIVNNSPCLMAFYILSGLVVIIGIVVYSRYIVSMNNRTKERCSLFLVLFLSSFILSCLSTYYSQGLYIFSYLVPVLSLLFSVSVVSVKNKWILSLFRIIFIVCVALWIFSFFR